MALQLCTLDIKISKNKTRGLHPAFTFSPCFCLLLVSGEGGLSQSLALTHKHTHSLSLARTHTRTHTHTLSLAVPLYLSFSIPHIPLVPLVWQAGCECVCECVCVCVFVCVNNLSPTALVVRNALKHVPLSPQYLWKLMQTNGLPVGGVCVMAGSHVLL